MVYVFVQDTQELEMKQQWYQDNQLLLTEEQDEEYNNYCSEKTLQISATHKRLRMY